jgi:hypothetical protein
MDFNTRDNKDFLFGLALASGFSPAPGELMKNHRPRIHLLSVMVATRDCTILLEDPPAFRLLLISGGRKLDTCGR